MSNFGLTRASRINHLPPSVRQLSFSLSVSRPFGHLVGEELVLIQFFHSVSLSVSLKSWGEYRHLNHSSVSQSSVTQSFA